MTFVPLEAPRPGPPLGRVVCKPIGEVRWRERVRVEGRIRAMRVQPWEGGVATLEVTVVDETGGIVAIFMGRQQLAGVRLGAQVELEGMVVEARGQLAIMNPEYTLLPHQIRSAEARRWRRGTGRGPPRPRTPPAGAPAVGRRGSGADRAVR